MNKPQIRVPAVNVLKVWTLCGRNSQNAATYIGCHSSTIARIVKDGDTTEKLEARALEALATIEAEAKAREQKAAAPAQLLVSVPPTKLEAFEKVISAMGCSALAL